MTQPNITFVSIIVRNPEDPNPITNRIEWLYQLLDAKLPLVLYVCPFFQELIKDYKYDGLQIIPINIDNTLAFKYVHNCFELPALPKYRTDAKDTHFFCSLMNVKTEVIEQAVIDGYVHTPYVSFIDASIVKVLNDRDTTLSTLKNTVISDKLKKPIFPGCLDPNNNKNYTKEYIWNRICWMFCGGFFVLPTSEAFHWNTYCLNIYSDFLLEGHITWEVNIWAYIVSNGLYSVEWFPADHNDSMLIIPNMWCI